MNILLKHKKKKSTEKIDHNNSSQLLLRNYHNPVPELSPIITLFFIFCVQNGKSPSSEHYFLSNPYLEHKIVLNKKI